MNEFVAGNIEIFVCIPPPPTHIVRSSQMRQFNCSQMLTQPPHNSHCPPPTRVTVGGTGVWLVMVVTPPFVTLCLV